VDLLKERYHIEDPVLISADSRLGTQQSIFDEGTSTLLNSYIASVPATMAALFMSLLNDDMGGYGKRKMYPQTRSSNPLHY
jgi:hypothetical protein